MREKRRSTKSPLVEIRFTLEEYKELLLAEAVRGIKDTREREKITNSITQGWENLLAKHFGVKGEIRLQQLPLGSIAASGKINYPLNHTQVYARGTCHSRPYARKWVLPKDPKSPAQLACRERFQQANRAWKAEETDIKEFWQQKSAREPGMLGQNLYVRAWLKYFEQIGVPPGLGFRG
jgi:hypothetical protein